MNWNSGGKEEAIRVSGRNVYSIRIYLKGIFVDEIYFIQFTKDLGDHQNVNLNICFHNSLNQLMFINISVFNVYLLP